MKMMVVVKQITKQHFAGKKGSPDVFLHFFLKPAAESKAYGRRAA